MYLCLSSKAKSHQWSYFNVKLAANKCLVTALCCGKQILRDWNFNKWTVLSGSLWTAKPQRGEKYSSKRRNLILCSFLGGESYTNFKRKKITFLFRTDWHLSCSCSSPFSHSRNKNCFSNFRLPASSIVPCCIKDLIHFPLAHFS